MPDPIATATGDPSAAGAPASGAPAAPSQPAAPWYAAPTYTDDDRVFLENKGWTKQEVPVAPVALKSYRELERIMGAKAHALLPPKMDDPAARAEFFAKLGKPEQPDAYPLPKALADAAASGQKLNDKALGAVRGLAHKLDLLPHQFQGLIEGYEGMQAEAEEAATTAYNGQVSQTVNKLKTEFGDQYGEHVARGNLAMQQLGLSKDDVTGISEAIGVERATRLLMQLGGQFAQHKTVGLGGNGGKQPDGFITDAARARDQIAAIQRGDNPNFKKAMLDPSHPDHKNSVAQWREWQKAANSKG